MRVGKGRPSNSVIAALEMDFINYAFLRNKNLHNDRGIRSQSMWLVVSVARGRPRPEINDLRNMVGYYI